MSGKLCAGSLCGVWTRHRSRWWHPLPKPKITELIPLLDRRGDKGLLVALSRFS